MALYFAIGLSLFAGSEPGGLSLIWRDILDSCGLDNFCRISKKYTMGKKHDYLKALQEIFQMGPCWLFNRYSFGNGIRMKTGGQKLENSLQDFQFFFFVA